MIEAGMTVKAGPVAADVGALIAVMGDLTALLGDETAALARRDRSRVAELGARKEELALAYSDHLAALRAQPSVMGAANAETKARLVATANHFQDVLDENLGALDIAKRTHESMARAIGRAVAKVDAQTAGYSDLGTYAGGEKNTPSTAPIAIDRQI